MFLIRFRMRFSRFILVLAICAAFANSRAQTAGVRPTQILPQEFGGWQISGSPRTSSDAATADGVNAAVLKEYGCSDFETANYVRPSSRT